MKRHSLLRLILPILTILFCQRCRLPETYQIPVAQLPVTDWFPLVDQQIYWYWVQDSFLTDTGWKIQQYYQRDSVAFEDEVAWVYRGLADSLSNASVQTDTLLQWRKVEGYGVETQQNQVIRMIYLPPIPGKSWKANVYGTQYSIQRKIVTLDTFISGPLDIYWASLTWVQCLPISTLEKNYIGAEAYAPNQGKVFQYLREEKRDGGQLQAGTHIQTKYRIP
jgi:hypothetical protein